jgi:hypothetical protein
MESMTHALSALDALKSGQDLQIQLSKESLEIARAEIAAGNESMTTWLAMFEKRDAEYRKRSRTQVRVYGLMMAIIGAMSGLSLFSSLRH